MENLLKFKPEDQNNELAKVTPPKYEGDIGFDLPVVEACVIPEGQQATIPCRLSIELPPGKSALVLGRSSSNAARLLVWPAVIDNGYRGPMYIFVTNLSPRQILVKPGERIAQIVLIDNPGPVHVVKSDSLSETDRGRNGFGSSGGRPQATGTRGL